MKTNSAQPTPRAVWQTFTIVQKRLIDFYVFDFYLTIFFVILQILIRVYLTASDGRRCRGRPGARVETERLCLFLNGDLNVRADKVIDDEHR